MVMRILEIRSDRRGFALRVYAMSDGQRQGRTPQHEHKRRRQDFIKLIAQGVDPLTAAQESGQPADKALETLAELYKLRVVELEDAA
jgi:hypothetical protein